jgi:TRAP-type C4-dicarboxylate transport system permease small subunit
MKNNKVYQFRNLYSILIGLSCVVICNYLFYFTSGWLNTTTFMIIAAFYIPIYYGLLILIFKHDVERERNKNDIEDGFGFVKGEIFLLIGFVLTIICMVLSLFVRGI